MQKFTFMTHIVQQPFVFATGLAALVHSTWSLGTLFSGKQPEFGTVEFWGWLIPAFLIAFALDVGQIVTSSEIRAGKRGIAKYATFTVFAVATYYLQWLYIAHHMPDLDLAAGVRADWKDAIRTGRDVAIFIIPALLPLSTLLYTFSSGEVAHQPSIPAIEVQPLEVVAPLVQAPMHQTILVEEMERPALQQGNYEAELTETKPEELVRSLPTGKFLATCPDCGWAKSYEVEAVGKNGLKTHRNLHCPARFNKEVSNGHQSAVQPADFPQWLVDQNKER